MAYSFYWNDCPDVPEIEFNRQEAEKAKALAKLPICECCEEPIQQERAFYYNDQWFCEECEREAWSDIREDFLESVDIDD